MRGIYDIDGPDLAAEFVERLGYDLQDDSCPPEIQQLGRTIVRWPHQIADWHRSRVSNGPTEAINLLIKQVKRSGRRFRNLATYRLRILLAGGTNPAGKTQGWSCRPRRRRVR